MHTHGEIQLGSRGNKHLRTNSLPTIWSKSLQLLAARRVRGPGRDQISLSQKRELGREGERERERDGSKLYQLPETVAASIRTASLVGSS